MKRLSGVLLVDKPAGPTSHDVVGTIRRASGVRRVGHAGTLDPFASGLLLVLLGPATRLSEYFVGMDKEYEATVRLGVETATHDPEGAVLGESDGWRGLDLQALEAALATLRGKITQRPPVYSAKKVRGEAAHRRVRRGETVALEPVEVEVYRLEIMEVRMPSVSVRLRCSSGTYVRALARDLGRRLGVGGHLSLLRRTGIGPFEVESATALQDLPDLGTIQEALRPPAAALAHLPSLEVGTADAARILQGQALNVPGLGPHQGGLVMILKEGDLLAVGVRDGDRLRPRKVFADG